MNAMSIIGTFCAIERADKLAIEAGGLDEAYLLALMTRDAKIWKARQSRADAAFTDDPGEHVQPHLPRVVETSRVKDTPAKISKREQAARDRALQDRLRAEFVANRHPCVREFRPKLTGTLMRDQTRVLPVHRPRTYKPPRARAPEPKLPAVPKPPSVRTLAIAAGEKTYERELPCPKCGRHTYRTCNSMCAHCDSRPHRKPPNAHSLAEANGEKTYVREWPCKVCGGKLFRTHNRACIECHNRKKRKAYTAKTETTKLKRNETLAPLTK
jgi:ribosomal protein L37E